MRKTWFSGLLLVTLSMFLTLIGAVGMAGFAQAKDDQEIINYVAYSESLASAGQPTQAQLEAISRAGLERVVYLAFADHETSLSGEDRMVRDLGMQFVHIPVVWSAPTVADYELFAAVMQQSEGVNTLVHCQVNWRASSFVFLYRVIVLGVPMNDAVLALNSIWTPSDGWREFIVAVLKAHGLKPDCEFCAELGG